MCGKRRSPFDNRDKSSFDSEEKREIVDGVAGRNKRIYLSTFSAGDMKGRDNSRDLYRERKFKKIPETLVLLILHRVLAVY
jgi:hypothetical protein